MRLLFLYFGHSFPINGKGWDIRFGFVKLLVILQTSLKLLVSSTYKVFCQVFDNCSLIAESICPFKELMRGRSVMTLRPKPVPFLNEHTSGGCNLKVLFFNGTA
jgi:hypothetical protein